MTGLGSINTEILLVAIFSQHSTKQLFHDFYLIFRNWDPKTFSNVKTNPIAKIATKPFFHPNALHATVPYQTKLFQPQTKIGIQDALSVLIAVKISAKMDFTKKTIKRTAKIVILACLRPNAQGARIPSPTITFRPWTPSGTPNASFVPLVTNLLWMEIFSNMKALPIVKPISMLSKAPCVLDAPNPFLAGVLLLCFANFTLSILYAHFA